MVQFVGSFIVQLVSVRQQFAIQFNDSFKWFGSISMSVVVRLQFVTRSGRLVHPAV